MLVDESNVGSSVRTAGRGLDWLKLRDFLAGPNSGRDLIEMVVYAGLPPAIPAWQDERDKKNKFVHWLRSNGFKPLTLVEVQNRATQNKPSVVELSINSHTSGK